MKIYNFLIFASLIFVIISKSFAGSCPDGSDPVKSISVDGTYFVYNCGGQASSSSATTNSKAGTVKVTMKPDRGDWIPNETGDDGLPMWSVHDVKRQMIHNPLVERSSRSRPTIF